MKEIPSQWSTKHLHIQDSEETELDQLQAVYESCAYIGKWEMADQDRDPEAMKKELQGRDLPPEGKAEYHRVQSIYQGEILIGYFCLYHGFPEATTFWIASLAINPEFQGKKYGEEAIYGLSQEVQKLNQYTHIGGSVAVKNWPALRFWIRNGFREILQFEGDATCEEKTFADLWLLKKL